jgi:hypothetical protein
VSDFTSLSYIFCYLSIATVKCVSMFLLKICAQTWLMAVTKTDLTVTAVKAQVKSFFMGLCYYNSEPVYTNLAIHRTQSLLAPRRLKFMYVLT